MTDQRDDQHQAYAQHMLSLQEQAELKEFHEHVDRINRETVPDMTPPDMGLTKGDEQWRK